jgi:hypothetical protein
MVMAHFLPLVVGLLMLAGTHASDVADRSMHQGFLSQYMGSDASKPSLDDYNKFVTPWFNHMKHGGALDAPSYYNGAAEHDPATMFDKAAHPTTPAQDSMATSVRREPLIAKDSNPSKIVDKEEVRAAQKVFANDNSVPIGMYAIGVSCLTLAAMLGVHMRRGLQQATAFASSGGHESDISIALAPAAAGNILELKTQDSTVKGQMGWSQQSSKNSLPLTFCYAGPSGAADFTDVHSLPGILAPTGFFDPTGLFDLAGLFESVSSSVLKRDKPARVEFGDFSALNEADARRLQEKADKLQDEKIALELQEIRLRNKAMELQGGRDAELTHDSVAMLASLGFLVGESGATASTKPALVEFGEFSALNKADARRLQEKADKLQGERIALELQEIRQDERIALELQEIRLRNQATELQGGR